MIKVNIVGHDERQLTIQVNMALNNIAISHNMCGVCLEINAFH